VLNNPKVTVHFHTQAVDVFGTGSKMAGLRIKNSQTGEIRD